MRRSASLDARPEVGSGTVISVEPREAFRPVLDAIRLVKPELDVPLVEAGVDVVQVFDSWVGALSPADYREFVQPHVRAIFDALADLDVPTPGPPPPLQPRISRADNRLA